MILKGKTALVTGSSDGIGKQIALNLAGQGVSLALLAKTKEKLLEVKKEALALGSLKVEVYPCDLKDRSQIKNTAESIIKDFGKIDILINNAGVWQKKGQLESATLEDIENIIGTNLTGLIMLTKLILPELRKCDEAALINVSSHSGIESKPGQALYCASKWGVTGFTETLRDDLKGTNVRVAGVYQGGTHTTLFEKANDPIDPEQFAKFTNPKDLAEVVVFMLSRPPKIWLHDVRVEY